MDSRAKAWWNLWCLLVNLPRYSITFSLSVLLVFDSAGAIPSTRGLLNGQKPGTIQRNAFRAAAEQAFQEGLQLYKLGTAESLRSAILKWFEALQLWQQLNDQPKQALTLTGIGKVYDDLGEKQKALEYYNQALPLETLLQKDRFRLTSSTIDDVRGWLTSGGVSRVQLQLDRQMKASRLATSYQKEIHDFLEQLVLENQRPLMQLIADGIIPLNQADFLVTMGISASEFDAMLKHMEDGTNPFETWMLANGYSQEIIDQIYQIIDRWLVLTGCALSRTPF